MGIEPRDLLSFRFALLAGCVLLGSRAEAQHYTQTNLVSDQSGRRDVHGPQSRQPLGSLPKLDEPVVGREQRHRDLDALQRQHGRARVAGRDHSRGIGKRLRRSDGNRVQRDDRLPAHPRQRGSLPVRDRGRHDLGLEPGGGPDARRHQGHEPGRGLQGSRHRVRGRGPLSLRDQLRQAPDRGLRLELPPGPPGRGRPARRRRFEDERIPRSFSPFNVQNIGGDLYVTFARRDPATNDDVAGPGLGYVDVFSPSGRLLRRLEHGPWLNGPWGLSLTPSDFGAFSHNLLVGQFGSGEIAAYDVATGAFLGEVRDTSDRRRSRSKACGRWASATEGAPGRSTPSSSPRASRTRPTASSARSPR